MYISFFILTNIISFLYFDKERMKICFYSLIFLLVLFAGTRGSDVSADYEVYEYIFTTAIDENYSYFFMYTGTELSAFIIPKFLHLFFSFEEDVIKYSFVIFAFLGVFFKLKVLQKSEYFFLGFILYISNLYWGQEMITIRAGVASGIFLLSIKDIVDKNDKSFLIKMIFALFFHISSVLFILYWAISKLKTSIQKWLLSLLISIIIATTKVNLFSILYLNKLFPKIQSYLDAQDLAGGDQVNVFNFMAMMALFIMFFFLITINKFKDNILFDVLFKIHIFSLIIFFALSPVNMVFSLRSFELFSGIQLLLYPMILKAFPNSLKFIGYTAIIFFSIIQFYYFIYYSNLFNNYTSWLL